jgi:Uracil DNA glycosylase superfamily
MLPDYLQPDLRLVLVGTAVGVKSAARGHYYAGPGNDFWAFLYEAGLTPTRLTPNDDASLPRYGIGLTDLVKSIAQSHDRGLPYDVPPSSQRSRPTNLASSRSPVRRQARRSRERWVSPFPRLVWQLGRSRADQHSFCLHRQARTEPRPTRRAWRGGGG